MDIKTLFTKKAATAPAEQIPVQPHSTPPQSSPKMRPFLTSIAEVLSPKLPDLKQKLRLAELDDNPVPFIESLLKNTIFISLGLIVLALILLKDGFYSDMLYNNYGSIALKTLALVIFVPIIIFFYLMLYPEALILRRQKELDYEIVFAGRHIAIALKSGLPLFDAFAGATKGYGSVSREFGKIADKVVLGVPMSQAIREITQNNSSKYFNRILMQIVNSLSSGSDVGDALETVLEQISKEQVIAIKEYSQKLTPIVMFYMVFGIIVPSLGIVLATVIFAAVSAGKFGFSSSLLVPILLIIGLVQFLFLGFVEGSRPKYII